MYMYRARSQSYYLGNQSGDKCSFLFFMPMKTKPIFQKRSLPFSGEDEFLKDDSACCCISQSPLRRPDAIHFSPP